MSTLQRSSSAPQTLPELVPGTVPRRDLPRSKSHLHVQKHDARPYLKPLVTSTHGGGSEPEDPFNLSGFFPRDEESWRWLRAEPEPTIEETVAEGEDEDAECPRLFGEGEERAAGGEEKKKGGGLSLSLLWTQETEVLSPYRVGEGEDYESLYESHCGRRRTASRPTGGGPEAGFGVLFFPGSS